MYDPNNNEPMYKSLHTLCSILHVPSVLDDIPLQDILHFELISIVVRKHEGCIWIMCLMHVHFKPLIRDIPEVKLLLPRNATDGSRCHLLPHTPWVHQPDLLSHFKLHRTMHTLVVAITNKNWPSA
jgi:hypothetical protein